MVMKLTEMDQRAFDLIEKTNNECVQPSYSIQQLCGIIRWLLRNSQPWPAPTSATQSSQEVWEITDVEAQKINDALGWNDSLGTIKTIKLACNELLKLRSQQQPMMVDGEAFEKWLGQMFDRAAAKRMTDTLIASGTLAPVPTREQVRNTLFHTSSGSTMDERVDKILSLFGLREGR